MLNTNTTTPDENTNHSDAVRDSHGSTPRKSTTNKRSYTVTCSSSFRDAVTDLAAKRSVNAADLARSVVLLLPKKVIQEFSDPGEPVRDDREIIILKSGPSAGRPWRRKPRLQVRMAEGYDPELIRRALGIALSMADGDATVSLEAPGITSTAAAQTDILMLEEKLSRFRSVISSLSFKPLPTGINTREEALHVLGFAPGRYPTMDVVKTRYRELASIHHPDGDHGNHTRMSQLNEAMEVLRRSLM